MILQESIIQNVSSLRLSPGKPPEESYFAPYSSLQRRNAEETGYDLARDLYRPHITLTRYKENLVPDVFPAFPEVALSFDVSRLCVYRADENGAAYEELGSFDVRKY